jgi:hypothetical protein
MHQFNFMHGWTDAQAESTRNVFAYRIKKMRENYPVLLTLAERDAAKTAQREQAIKDFEKWQASQKQTSVDASQHINYNE